MKCGCTDKGMDMDPVPDTNHPPSDGSAGVANHRFSWRCTDPADRSKSSFATAITGRRAVFTRRARAVERGMFSTCDQPNRLIRLPCR
jgi:hypothetical protein